MSKVAALNISNNNPKKSISRSMEEQLSDFLTLHRVKRGDPFTHTTLSPSGIYYISEEDLDTFFTLYCNAVRQGIKHTLTERPGPYFPLRVDFDLKANLAAGKKRQYTKEMVKQIISIYQDIIKGSVAEEEFDDKLLICIILEKPAPRVEEGIVKDGFHLHFPYFICEGWVQDEYFRSKVNERMLSEGIWNTSKYTTAASQFIDTGMAKKQWLMYGSAKKYGASPYLATYVLNHQLEEIPIDHLFEEKMLNRKSSVRYYLPRFLSIRGYTKYIRLKEEVETKRSSYGGSTKKRKVVPHKRRTEDILADIRLIKDAGFISMLSTDRADNYTQWLEVGFVLFNIGEGCPEALDLWIDFSKRSAKFVDGECEEKWNNMRLGDYTMGTIKYMAQHDDPDEYKRWKETDKRSLQFESLKDNKATEWDVARVVHCMYRDTMKCADSKKEMWYIFENHRWRRMDDGVSLRRKLATEVVDEYNKLKMYLLNNQIGQDTDERSKNEEKEQRCNKIIKDLRTCTFQDKVVRMCKILFHDQYFLRKIDENRSLFVCENGVLDLNTLQFRDGYPDDYATYSCGLEYRRYTDEDDEMKELRDFLNKVFTNQNIREYFLDTACAAMEGGNINKIFIVGTGVGDNAKSITYSLLENTFGGGADGYCIKFPRELLIVGRGNSSGGPRPELARVRGKRLALAQEIAKTETLNIGVLKELTGNDSFFARGMFKDGEEIKPHFSFFMQCNEAPRVPGHDDATWNRIRIIDYSSKFVLPKDSDKYPVPADEAKQFKMRRFKADPSFAKRLPDMAPVFLSLLFDRYQDYKKRGLKEPDEVKYSTNSYRVMNDVYLQFIEEMLEKTPANIPAASQPFLKLSEVFPEFNTWYSINHSSYSKEKITKITLLHEFNKKLGAATKQGKNVQGWAGYRIICEGGEGGEEKQQLQRLISTKAK